MRRSVRRTFAAIGGGVVLVIGIIAIPYPGPGWLIVFAGLGILATEFDWAKRILEYVKGKYDAWQDWLSQQAVVVKILFWCLTAIVVATTIWLLNGYGLLNSWLHLHQGWLHSPLLG